MKSLNVILSGCFIGLAMKLLSSCSVEGSIAAAPGIEKECVDGVIYLISSKAGIAPAYKPDGSLVECPVIVP